MQLVIYVKDQQSLNTFLVHLLGILTLLFLIAGDFDFIVRFLLQNVPKNRNNTTSGWEGRPIIRRGGMLHFFLKSKSN